MTEELNANAEEWQVTKHERKKALEVLRKAKALNRPVRRIPQGFSYEIEKLVEVEKNNNLRKFLYLEKIRKTARRSGYRNEVHQEFLEKLQQGKIQVEK